MADINYHFGEISEPTFYSYINALKKTVCNRQY